MLCLTYHDPGREGECHPRPALERCDDNVGCLRVPSDEAAIDEDRRLEPPNVVHLDRKHVDPQRCEQLGHGQRNAMLAVAVGGGVVSLTPWLVGELTVIWAGPSTVAELTIRRRS